MRNGKSHFDDRDFAVNNYVLWFKDICSEHGLPYDLIDKEPYKSKAYDLFNRMVDSLLKGEMPIELEEEFFDILPSKLKKMYERT